ncbi:MAG: hypothetical protein AAF587_43785 [Bacteroidota bacterium]
MDIFIQTDVTVEPSFKTEATVMGEGSHSYELACINILFRHGILFSAKKGRARRDTPADFLRQGRAVPVNLKHVVLVRGLQPGIKLWGRIDFLLNYRGYKLLDERK